jgi:DNA anti-recombination protein RmuC
MPDVTNDLMYEVLKKIQYDMGQMKDEMRVMSGEMQALRGHFVAFQKDIANIYDKMVGHELRLDRIERRFDLIGEPAE